MKLKIQNATPVRAVKPHRYRYIEPADTFIIACVFIVALLLTSCGASSPYYKEANNRPASDHPPTEVSDNEYTLFFIGDTGDPSTEPLDANLKTLQNQLEKAGENTSVIFLGDNIYDYGLLPEDHPLREDSERRINTQLDILENYKGRTVFIPGNHDWNNDKPGGLAAINRQADYIKEKLQDTTAFLPSDGCPGPVDIPINKSNVLLVMDTEWWLYPHKKPGAAHCKTGTKERFAAAVDSLVKRYHDRTIYVAAHHPLYSNGTHGGYFPLSDHLFPLLDISPALYIPLPIIGSVKPIYRKHWGYLQDIAHDEYQVLKNELTVAFKPHPRLIYVAGHDHSLQHHPIGKHHYIITGSGTVKSYVRKGKAAAFVYSQKGFSRIDISPHEVVLNMYVPEEGYPGGKLVYRSVLYSNK